MGRRIREPAGGIVIEPAPIHDAHAAFADAVTEHCAAPIFEVELRARPDRELRFDDCDPALRAKASLVDDDAFAPRTDSHAPSIWQNVRDARPNARAPAEMYAR